MYNWLCVHTLLNSTTYEGCSDHRWIDKAVLFFQENLLQTFPKYEDSTPVCETSRKASKVGG